MQQDLDNLAVEYIKHGRSRGLEEGHTTNATPLFKKVRPELLKDFKFVDFTIQLHAELFPPAEDQIKGNLWQERVEDLYKAFESKRSIMIDFSRTGVTKQLFDPTKALPLLEFTLKMPTIVKEKVSTTEYSTLKSNTDKTIKVYAQPMLDERLQRGLLFGLLRDK